MPLIKIEIEKGKSPEFLDRLMTLTGDVLVEILGIPQDDRNIRVTEYEPGLISFKSPYALLFEITLFQGRTRATKKLLYRTLVDTLHRELGIPPESVFIVLYDVPLENWGVRGGIPGDEIKLSFDINR